MSAFDIDYDAKPLTSHWEHMRRADEHLEGVLFDMRTMTRLWSGEMDAENPADVIALNDMDIDPAELEEDNADLGYQQFDAWALELRVARWSPSRIHPNGFARVFAVLGTGGPHVEVDFLFDTNGRPESVELRRYWSERDAARTSDREALAIVEEFCEAFLGQAE